MSNETPESLYEKSISSELFQRIKPLCVQLNNIAGLHEEARIISLLTPISSQVRVHVSEYAKEERLYIISPKLADYIFFPLSNLLKQQALSDSIVLRILELIAFLLKHAWNRSPSIELIDQLYPLIIYLATGAEPSKREDIILAKSLDFKESALAALTNLVNLLPRDYYNFKRLPLLGDTITVILAAIMLSDANSEEQLKMIDEGLSALTVLSGCLTHDKLAHVLPGIVSKLTLFSTSRKNLNTNVLLKITTLFKVLLVAVFNDEELGAKLRGPEVANLEDLKRKTESGDELKNVHTVFNSKEEVFRTREWLQKSTEPLMKTLSAYFKCLLLSSNQNKIKLQTKLQLSDALVSLVVEVFNNCHASLFGSFVPIAIESLALLVSILPSNSDEEQNKNVKDIAHQLCVIQHPKVLFDQVKNYYLDLVENRISILGFSSDEEKLGSYLVAVKLSFCIIYQLSYYLPNEITELKRTLYSHLLNRLSDSFEYRGDKTMVEFNKKDLLAVISGEKKEDLDNALDDIQLPPSIDAKKVKKFNQKKSENNQAHASDLVILAQQFNDDTIQHKLSTEKPGYLKELYTPQIEKEIAAMIGFVGSLAKDVEIGLMEDILNVVNSEDKFSPSFALWIANTYLSQYHSFARKNFDINDFMDLDEGSDEHDHDEASYLLLSQAQELNELVSDSLGVGKISEAQKMDDFAMAVSLDSLAVLSNTMSLDDFQTDVLMDSLYPLLEALSYDSNSLTHQSAWRTTGTIVQNYYGGSLEALILDNLDYIIDSLSINLSVGTKLTPSLPALLLIVIKVAGVKLLEENKLMDVLTEIFVTIDSYHGYSVIVEGFFIVFLELVSQIRGRYLSDQTAIDLADSNSSPYKPWGMDNVHQLLKLISDSQKLIDPCEYDGNADYFKPSKVEELDSDDEDQPEEPAEENKEVWPSPIPEATYFLAQRIFIYGFTLLNHDSYSLKVQVLRSMLSVYPLLCTNYKLVLPIVASNWGILMALLSGTGGLGSTEEFSITREKLIVPTLELMLMMLREDTTERFLGRKFMESWEFLRDKVLTKLKRLQSKELVRSSKSLLRVSNLHVLKLYSEYILTGLCIYERTVNDTTKFEMLTFCHKLGLPDNVNLNVDMQNMLYVIQHT